MIFTSSCCDNLSIDEIIERAEKGDCEAQYIVGFYYNRDSAIDSPDDEKAFYWGRCEQVPDMRSCLSSGAIEQGSS